MAVPVSYYLSSHICFQINEFTDYLTKNAFYMLYQYNQGYKSLVQYMIRYVSDMNELSTA